MKQNLGKLDRIFRFALAFWWLGPWSLRTGIVVLDWIIIAAGVIALFESFIGFCLFHDLVGINNKNH